MSLTVECSDPRGPPREVSPPGAAMPLFVRDGGTISWEPATLSDSDTFDVQRGLVVGPPSRAYGACWQANLAATTVRDDELPGRDQAWFHLVAGRNPAGLGPLGSDSFGAPRASPTRCP